MSWVINRSLVKAEVSNAVRGVVSGKLWLHGRESPVSFEFQGDAGDDIAGCNLLIENPSPERGERIDLDPVQGGKLIDCTASHRIVVPLVSPYEARRLRQDGRPVPCRLDNGFRLSWVSPVHGEVVIEGAGFSIFTSVPQWNGAAARVARGPDIWKSTSPGDVPPGQQFDEQAWGRMLRTADASNALYNKLLEQYGSHPDRDRIIAREMGWPFPDAQPAAPDATLPPDTVADLPFPLPEKHKVDWIVTAQGDVAHPVADQAMRLYVNIRRECRRLIVADESRVTSLEAFTGGIQELACKLAGALNGLAYDKVVDCAFVVAYLKRSLGELNAAMGAHEAVANQPWFPRDLAARCREEFHALRGAILGLMERFRAD